MAFLMAAITVHAGEIVGVVFPFGIGESPANYVRTTIQQANSMQDKYTFVFEHRPGAGGAVGAEWVATRNNYILASSSAFFLRPILYPKESYDVSDFVPLVTQCDLPMVVISGKYKNWNEVPKDRNLNIGVSGLGAMSHLVSLQIQKKFPNLEVIPYKGTTDQLSSLASGQVDFGVGFIGETSGWSKTGKINVLGTTGGQSIQGIPSLKSQGFNTDNIVASLALYVSKNTSDEKYNEWREILSAAVKSKLVTDSYQADACRPNILDKTQTLNWYQTQLKQWKIIAGDITIK